MERFEGGELKEVKSEFFSRNFFDSTLDTFKPDEKERCEDIYGDKGWIVGFHKEVKPERGEGVSWYWVVRDRDNALIGIQKCNLRR